MQHNKPLFTVKLDAFFTSNTFISIARVKFAKKIKQMLSNTLRLNFRYLKIIHILHLHYHPKIIGRTLKNKQKSQSACILEIMQSIIKMEMKMKMKNRSLRYDINRPRSRHGHKWVCFFINLMSDGKIDNSDGCS